MGVRPYSVTLRSMRGRWGSCSTEGRRISERDLLRQPAAYHAEVIVHELLHLRHPRHDKVFHALLRVYLAEYGVQGRPECGSVGSPS